MCFKASVRNISLELHAGILGIYKKSEYDIEEIQLAVFEVKLLRINVIYVTKSGETNESNFFHLFSKCRFFHRPNLKQNLTK